MKKLATLVDLSQHSMDKLAELGSICTYGEGTVLFREGEHHERIYFIVSGTLKLEMNTSNYGRQTLLTVGSGDVLAWSAILGDGTMTSTALVSEPSQLIAIVSTELNKQFQLDCMFGYEMMKVIAKALSKRLLATRLQLLDLYCR